jgi:hypothetical protein
MSRRIRCTCLDPNAFLEAMSLGDAAASRTQTV